MSRNAVFLDRDDTLIHDCHYIKDPNLVQLFDDTIPSLRRLKASGFMYCHYQPVWNRPWIP